MSVNLSSAESAAPTILDGRYRIQALLGHGGMGCVYAAEDLRLGRQVAIKVVRSDAADSSLGERLFREARAAARSDHPAIVTAFGYGSDPELGVDYFVMERLHGETVGQRIARTGPLPLALVRHIGLGASEALIAVHDAGVIHRDLKPNNLFLSSRRQRIDELKLLDFGVAKQDNLQPLTSTGQVWGTPAYMAPEQLCDSKRVDARCDVYALGAVLWECLAGRPVFEGPDTVAMAYEIARASSPSIRSIRAETPEPLADIIAQCMQRDPDLRFQDALALHAALLRWEL